MTTTLRRSLALAVLAAALALSGTAPAAEEQPRSAREPTANDMLLDVLIVRPLGIARTALGTGIFIISLPFSMAGDNVGEAAEKLIFTPARQTFRRPLGDIRRRD